MFLVTPNLEYILDNHKFHIKQDKRQKPMMSFSVELTR